MSIGIFWLVIATALLIATLLTGLFHFLLLALAALITALAVPLGLEDWWAALALFGVVSGGSLALFRGQLQAGLRGIGQARLSLTDQAQHLVLEHAIPANGEGAVIYQGSPWVAVNRSDHELPAGSQVQILATEGVKLIVG
jgi:membrane protein implicated in regulation of membrane protease activity